MTFSLWIQDQEKKNYFYCYIYFFEEWFCNDEYMQEIESMPSTKHWVAVLMLCFYILELQNLNRRSHELNVS